MGLLFLSAPFFCETLAAFNDAVWHKDHQKNQDEAESNDFNLVMAAAGGLSSIWGAPVGVALILIIEEFLRARLHLIIEGASGEIEVIAFGLILILLMIFMPDGIIKGSQRLAKKWTQPKEQPQITT